MNRRLYSPYLVMTIVISMYVVKVCAKLSIASVVHSPVLAGDGLHNLADIAQALIVILTVFYARQPSDAYPFGRKSAESLLSLFIVAGLLFTAGVLVLNSIDKLLGLELDLPHFLKTEKLAIQPQYLWVLIAITLGSFLLSLIVSRYQVTAGKATGDGAVVSDGQETLGDGWIELATFFGVIGEYLWHIAWLEYVLSLVVAGLIIRTAYEIGAPAKAELLKKSIGREYEDEITRIVNSGRGARLLELKTFRVGSSTAICILKIETDAQTAEAMYYQKHGFVARIVAYLKSAGFTDADYYVRFEHKVGSEERYAYGIIKTKGAIVIAPALKDATHFRICDVMHGKCIRAFDEEKQPDPVKQLTDHKVSTCYFLDPRLSDAAMLPSGINYKSVPYYALAVLGID